MSIREIAKGILGTVRYCAPARIVLNRLTNHTIQFGRDVSVKSGCTILGDIKIGDQSSIGKSVFMYGSVQTEEFVGVGESSHISGEVTIGRGTNLVRNNQLAGEIEIGRYCAIGPNVCFQQKNHLMSLPAIQFKLYTEVLNEKPQYEDTKPIVVGSDVWFGMSSIILPGVEIGHGAIIGAGAVVTKDVQPYEIVGGNPAKHIGWRFEEESRNQLLDIAWWNWTPERISNNADLFVEEFSKKEDMSSESGES